MAMKFRKIGRGLRKARRLAKARAAAPVKPAIPISEGQKINTVIVSLRKAHDELKIAAGFIREPDGKNLCHQLAKYSAMLAETVRRSGLGE